MQRGTATLDRSWTNVLAFGLGSSRLTFNADEGKKTVVMSSWAIKRSFYCEHCGAITIAATPPC